MIQLRGPLARLGAAAALSLGVGASALADVQSVVAREGPGGVMTLWSTPAAGTAAPSLQVEAFLPVHLVGYPLLASLRRDRPAPVTSASAPHIRLPQGGALYRVALGGSTGWLLADATAPPRLLLEIPDGAGVAGLAPEVHVSPEGSLAIVSSPQAAAGGVWVLDLISGQPAHCLTASGPPIEVAPESVRVSNMAAWFVESGALRMAAPPLLGQAQPSPLDLGPLERVHPELAMADGGGSVVALVEGKPGECRLVSVFGGGWAQTVTTGPGTIDPPGYDDPFGPFLAVSPDGFLVGFRVGAANPALFAKRLDLPSQATQLTSPTPPSSGGIDNIGVLGMAGVGAVSFLAPRTLAFVAGDLSQLAQGEDEIESAELFAAEFPAPGQVVYTNLTQTSGQTVPPFNRPGTLEVAAAFLDPSLQRILVYGESPSGEDELVSVRLDPAGGSATITSLAADLDEAPLVLPAAEGVLIASMHDSNGGAIAVDLLPPPMEGVPDALVPLVLLPQEREFLPASYATDCTHAAFAVRGPGDVETPWVVDLGAQQAYPLRLGAAANLAPAFAFDSAGRLVLGVDPAGGEAYRFLALDAAGPGPLRRAALLAIAPGKGFPLEL